jgi:hypothetical protein
MDTVHHNINTMDQTLLQTFSKMKVTTLRRARLSEKMIRYTAIDLRKALTYGVRFDLCLPSCKYISDSAAC